MKRHKGEIATLLTLGFVVVGAAITLITSVITNQQKNIASNPRAATVNCIYSTTNQCSAECGSTCGSSQKCINGKYRCPGTSDDSSSSNTPTPTKKPETTNPTKTPTPKPGTPTPTKATDGYPEDDSCWIIKCESGKPSMLQYTASLSQYDMPLTSCQGGSPYSGGGWRVIGEANALAEKNRLTCDGSNEITITPSPTKSLIKTPTPTKTPAPNKTSTPTPIPGTGSLNGGCKSLNYSGGYGFTGICDGDLICDKNTGKCKHNGPTPTNAPLPMGYVDVNSCSKYSCPSNKIGSFWGRDKKTGMQTVKEYLRDEPSCRNPNTSGVSYSEITNDPTVCIKNTFTNPTIPVFNTPTPTPVNFGQPFSVVVDPVAPATDTSLQIPTDINSTCIPIVDGFDMDAFLLGAGNGSLNVKCEAPYSKLVIRPSLSGPPYITAECCK